LDKPNKLVLHLATFADGNSEIIAAGERLIKQANQSNLFSSTLSFDKAYLEDFLDESAINLMSTRHRGFGYWIWKPLLIKQLLRDVVKENEILVYTDAGTELNFNLISSIRFQKLASKTQGQPVLAFRTKEPEFRFTKRKCLEILDNKFEIYTNQIEATTLFVRNVDASRKFVDEWVNISISQNYSFIDDSLSNEVPGFIDHRHDQSIFSILYKNFGFTSYHLKSPEYSDNPKRISNFQRWAFNGFAIWSIRNRSGYTILNPWQTRPFAAILSMPFYWMNKPHYVLTRLCKKVYFFATSRIRVDSGRN